VLIFKFSVCGGKPEGDKLFRKSIGQVSSPELPS